jgi:hypothetical protein
MGYLCLIFGKTLFSLFLPGDSMNTKKQLGGILIMTVIFVMMLTVMFVSLSNMTNTQFRQGGISAQDEMAFQVAEAGLDFAKWRLAHDPTNYTAVSKDVVDQLKGTLGTYSITFTGPQTGSTLIRIVSVGHSLEAPDREVTIEASYGKPSFARYASLTNDDVWYKSAMSGAVHSNGGIRMDGTSDSSVTSAKETYVCQSFHGCANLTKPGVWGTGTDSSFWQYPVPSVDYTGLTVDLLTMKSNAQASGTYYGPSGAYGYRIIFNATNTYTAYRVTGLSAPTDSYASDTGWQNISHDIGTQTRIVLNKPVPSNGVIYFEDRVWISGEIRDRVTVAAGVLPDTPSTNVDVILNGNTSYGGVLDGTRMLGVIAQGNLLIPRISLTDLRLDGAFVAQHGRFGRRFYPSTTTYTIRNSLTRYGMVASNLVPVTAWSSGTTVVSGYRNSYASYDPNLLYAPPPFFPTSGEYQILSWDKK